MAEGAAGFCRQDIQVVRVIWEISLTLYYRCFHDKIDGFWRVFNVELSPNTCKYAASIVFKRF